MLKNNLMGSASSFWAAPLGCIPRPQLAVAQELGRSLDPSIIHRAVPVVARSKEAFPPELGP